MHKALPRWSSGAMIVDVAARLRVRRRDNAPHEHTPGVRRARARAARVEIGESMPYVCRVSSSRIDTIVLKDAHGGRVPGFPAEQSRNGRTGVDRGQAKTEERARGAGGRLDTQHIAMPTSSYCPATVNCSWTLHTACPTPAARALWKYAPDAHREQLIHCCCDEPKPALGRLCNTAACETAHRIAGSRGECPRFVQDTWKVLPGFSEETNLAMACRPDGGWLAPGVEKFRGMHYGVNRSSAFRVTKDFCSSANWTYSHHQSRGPPILGTDRDIHRIIHGNHSLRVMALRVRMGRPFTLTLGKESTMFWLDPWAHLHGPLYTTCQNLAFIMCGVRGWLRSQQGSSFYLATAGSDIGRSCEPCGACRPDLSWDSCWITKQEYCTLARVCRNGHEVWSHRGHWQCVPNYDLIRKFA